MKGENMLFKKKQPMRYWDFSYIRNFINRNRNEIDFLQLTMQYDKSISEILIRDGNIVHMVDGQYQYGATRIDGVLYSTIDFPCMYVVYKGGNTELLRCYRDVNNIEPYSVSRKRVESTDMEYENFSDLLRA